MAQKHKGSAVKPGRETRGSALRQRPKAPSKRRPPKPRERYDYRSDGWERVPGKEKRMRRVDWEPGRSVSNRKYREEILYKGQSLETFAATRGAPLARYTRLLHARRDYLNSLGVKAGLKEIRQSADMKKIIRTLKAETRKLSRTKSAKEREKLLDADGAYAQALVELGYRDPDARYPVGES